MLSKNPSVSSNAKINAERLKPAKNYRESKSIKVDPKAEPRATLKNRPRVITIASFGGKIRL